ncbi:acyltransferase family protein [Paraburkholderia hospita]|uniref:acyltransferase family protein n=1 Tax=Paraburkholderia hospita TaxID=169430 RepID=UPI000B34132F|nr:acyltransferase [Paraburkholderia hospita]OUL82341.1 hypothetical protein CA603_28515 [Paraburkholderia hospita]
MTDFQKSSQNDEIQVLRAIAILMVLFFHSRALFSWHWDALADASQGFWSGVDLFLCVSGYVIAKTMAPRFRDSRGEAFWREAGAFWVRRLYRITPSAWLWVVVPITIGMVLGQGVKPNDLSDFAAIALHVANIHFYECGRGSGLCGQFVNYWSLALEEQFYLVLPLLFLMFRKSTVYVLISLVLLQLFIPRGPGTSILNVLKTDALLFGVLIAMFSGTNIYRILDPNLRSSKFRFIIPPLLLFCLVAVPRYEVVSFYTGLLAIVCAIIVWLCSYNRGYFFPFRLVMRPLKWIGDRSYAIYLIHGPMVVLTREIWQRICPPVGPFGGSYTLRFSLTAAILIFGLADLNFRFVERPLRRRGKRYADRILGKSEEVPAGTLPVRDSKSIAKDREIL